MTYSYSAVTETLKRVLRERAITYRQLADELGLSESGVKKIMSADDGSFVRLAEICAAASIDLFALLELAWKSPPEPFTFSDAQDHFMSEHPGHYYFWVSLMFAKLDVEKVIETHGLDRRSARRYLRDLDGHGFIELLPGDRMRLGPGVTERVRMGPKSREVLGVEVQKRFLDYVHRRAMAGEKRAGEDLVVGANLKMTADRLAAFTKDLHEVILRHGTDALADELLTPASQLIDVGLLVNVAPCDMARFYEVPRLEEPDQAEPATSRSR